MFTAKALEKVSNGKGSWESTRIGIFQNGTQVGEFLRNYSCFGEQTFYPFKREDKWYALYSPNYTAIRIMSLPDCRDIGGEEPASFGFCPVEIYIPEFQWAYRKGLSEDNLKKYPEQNHSWLSRDAEEKEYDPDLFNKDLDENHKFVYKEKETFFENFAFVAGCVWGDDRSMKIELRDITLAHEGIIKPVKDWGYYELPNDLSLKECVNLSAFERYVGEEKDAINVTITITKTIRVNRNNSVDDFSLQFFD